MAFRQVNNLGPYVPGHRVLHREFLPQHYFAGSGFEPMHAGHRDRVSAATTPGYFYVHHGDNVHIMLPFQNSNMAQYPSSIPLTRGSNSAYRDQVTDSNTDFLDPFWVQEEEAMIVDAIESLEPTSTHSAGGLSEEVISKYLEIRNCDKNNGDSEICIVCQDNLCREDDMMGMLGCGHNYHATCIKKWLQEKNICPLCKSTALSVD
ncbi:hypothetical protein BUALT_Bualt18G0047500 [Buddleja alternifolia]|uniref:RING-type E3 ubiquitin transferase n=1 Tax=Buddleja alternifolia TaxID=168488 RepID=A0AAV6WB32_9LAMI|nr:hypothetical protein BUALT_Bualt18G0047500 [Buddleja alternifolia]